MSLSPPTLIKHTYDCLLLAVMVLFSHNVLSNDRCDICLVTYSPPFDNLVVLDNQLWSRPAPHQHLCYRLCRLDSSCFSFQFNPITNRCRGHASTFTTLHLVNTSTESGNKLYLTCKGGKQIGSSCSTDADCLGIGTFCLHGICQCRSNLFTDVSSCDSNYLGCFKDSMTRVLPGVSYRNNAMTTEMCLDYCGTRRYGLAGTEAGDECHCGHSIPAGRSRDEESQCGYRCVGNIAQSCGGRWFISVYRTESNRVPGSSD